MASLNALSIVSRNITSLYRSDSIITQEKENSLEREKEKEDCFIVG